MAVKDGLEGRSLVMVGRKVLWSGIAVALLGARTVVAAPITFTGNVANDFNPQTNPGVVVITDSTHENDPIHIAQPSWMTESGLVSGWNIKDLRLDYNSSTDTMYVGVNTYGVAGNVDGNGTPGIPDPRLTASGGTDPANFGGDKSMAVGFAPLTGTFNTMNLPTPVIVAGISGNKAQAGPGLDGFNVATYSSMGGVSGTGNHDLVTSFGTTLTAGMGNLAFDPSLQHPGFEFTITNFSKITGINPANGMVVSVQDGSVDSIVTGKDGLVGSIPEAQQIPEPTTWMVWAGMAAGLAWTRYRRSRRTGP
jgi:hypothetical protein